MVERPDWNISKMKFSPKITQLKLLLYPGPLYFAKGGQLVKEHQLKIMKSEIKLLLMQTQ